MEYTIDDRYLETQSQWALMYMTIASGLTEEYQIEGKAVVREAVRKYAAAIAKARKKSLMEAGAKTNLETVFSDGFGFPAGENAKKEWILLSEQELFINTVSCPYADVWQKHDRAVGRMFCEEFYPVLVHESTSEKAQINLGMCLLKDEDNYCRHSFYLRPANMPAAQRKECFADFDTDYVKQTGCTCEKVDYQQRKVELLNAFLQVANECPQKDYVAYIKTAAKKYANDNDDQFVLNFLEEISQ